MPDSRNNTSDKATKAAAALALATARADKVTATEKVKPVEAAPAAKKANSEKTKPAAPVAAAKKSVSEKATPVEAVPAAKKATSEKTKAVKTELALIVKPNSIPEIQDAFGELVHNYTNGIEVLFKANTAWLNALQEINKTLVSVANSSFEQNTQYTKAILGSESVQDAVMLQSQFAQEAFIKSINEGQRLSNMTSRLVEQVAKPISSHFAGSV